MHMRGLQKALDVLGARSRNSPWLLAKVHRVDIKGAIALASTPYLPFRRYRDPVISLLPAAVRIHTSRTLRSLLAPLRVHPAVISSLTSLSLLGSLIRLARYPSDQHSVVLFDPHSFTEEWLGVMHALITQGGPLRGDDDAATNPNWNPFHQPSESRPAYISSIVHHVPCVPRTGEYMTDHRLKPSVAIMPAPLGPAGALEPALRIIGLLFVKELLPDWPRSFGGYAVLLSLLRGHVERILDDLAGGGWDEGVTEEGEQWWEAKCMTADQASAVVDTLDLDGGVADAPPPNRWGGYTKQQQQGQTGAVATPPSAPPNDSARTDKDDDNLPCGIPSTHQPRHNTPPDTPPTTTTASSSTANRRARLLRPLLLWIAVVGDLVTQFANANEARAHDGYPRDVFRRCLVEGAGVGGASDVDALSDDEDLVMFRLFDTRDMIVSVNEGCCMPSAAGVRGENRMEEEEDEEEDEEEEGERRGGVVDWDVKRALRGLLL